MHNQVLLNYLKEYARFEPHKKLLGDSHGWLTASQVLERVENTAGKLYGLGLRPGDWVALRMQQSVDAITTLLGLLAIGAVAPLTNAKTPVRQALEDARFDRPLTYTISNESGSWMLEKNGQLFSLAEAPAVPFEVFTDPYAPATVIFTSGSTGKSKAVMLSQNNLTCNLWAINVIGGYRKDDIALGALPMDHVFGLIMLYGAIGLRHSLYLTAGNDLDALLETISRQRITRMNGVTALYLGMVAKKDQYDLSSLRIGFIGGGPCTPAQFEKIEEELEMTLVNGYGMSECMGITAHDHRSPRDIRSTSVGPFYTVNEGIIMDENGRECEVGQIGEVCIRGPELMLGYCDEAQNKAAFDSRGFFHTSDLGYLDERGNLHLTGRTRDIIIRNGLNLSARKIEEALLSIPGVDDAMVVGLTHGAQGEAPWALVKADLTEEEILEKLVPLVAKNEIPMGICVTDAIPYNNNGKPDKIKGKELLAQWAKV